MAKRRNDTLSRKPATREYRPVCWVSAEGQTERDYLSMAAFRGATISVRFPQNVHPGRRNPSEVLARFKRALRLEDFRDGDEAWLVVDVDIHPESEFDELLQWEAADPRHHLAVSNPKFELFLVMHYERANGCTTPSAVDAKVRQLMPRYDKRLSATYFRKEQVKKAIENARIKRAGCPDRLPAPGMTDAHLLAGRLMEEA